MAFNPNIPNPNDLLSNSQGQLKSNNLSLNNTFAVDHYTFSNATTNRGKHNQVTTPLIVGGSHPTTAAAEPKFYAMQDSANLGVIQYSRGPSNAVPTPVTYLQSPSTPIVMISSQTITIFDFTGLPRASFQLFAGDFVLPNRYDLFYGIWSGSAFTGVSETRIGFAVGQSGAILQLTNTATATTYNNVYWTLTFYRLQ
jgi:hypothetical protein